MRDVITVYDTDSCKLAGKVRQIAERRGESATMNDVVREHLRESLEFELREWDRVDRIVKRLSSESEEELVDRENTLIEQLPNLSPARMHELDEIQAELKRRSKPTVG